METDVVSRKVYGWLLFLYPAEFRNEFGEEMVLAFDEQFRDAIRSRNPGETVVLWLCALRELFTVALPLQMQSALLVASCGSLVGTMAIYLLLLRALNDSSAAHVVRHLGR